MTITDRHAHARKILVTGATGHVGRHVVSELRDAGAHVRALVRNPDRANIADGVELVRGDLSVPESLEAGLEGVDAVFLVWPFLTVEAAPAVLETIAKHTRRLVYLSAASVSDEREERDRPQDDAKRPPLFHTDMERLIAASGLEWTFLRPTGFATNTLGWAPMIRAESVVRWPFGKATRSLIHERDIAAVAARALTSDGHVGQRYVLTGPRALTQIEQAQVIGEAIGRSVRYEDLFPDEARRVLLAAWGNPDFVEAAIEGWGQMVSQPEAVTSTVEQITGIPARTFHEWAVEHAADFR
ncbi:Oxidoreductase [Labilithrix luteola]|uniref:Oxidoreductase n=1 Tax=Labilithrix luteola TaxID=1391654 RepID=A0A0K1PNY3_9BACT|nr:NAD(P)H-binding protein [Labilithrix luteola]AKU95126.1 Oxidoreductase [Labilithrix luteola]